MRGRGIKGTAAVQAKAPLCPGTKNDPHTRSTPTLTVTYRLPTALLAPKALPPKPLLLLVSHTQEYTLTMTYGTAGPETTAAGGGGPQEYTVAKMDGPGVAMGM